MIVEAFAHAFADKFADPESEEKALCAMQIPRSTDPVEGITADCFADQKSQWRAWCDACGSRCAAIPA
jgi:hypothetical protein